MKRHRFAKGTTAHVTADRSDGPARRPRNTKPMSEGGTRPDLAPCKGCEKPVIHHRLAGGPRIFLDPAELKAGDDGARFIIIFGFVIQDPIASAVPEGMTYYREHACPSAPAPEP